METAILRPHGFRSPAVCLYAILAGRTPGPLAGFLLMPSQELARPSIARPSGEVPGFGVSPVLLPEDLNPFKRIQQ
jgi:hypothetical protein